MGVLFSTVSISSLSGSYYGNRASGEQSHSVDFLLHKTRESGAVPAVEKGKCYMLPNRSSFATIEEEHHLESTVLRVAIENLTIYFLQKSSGAVPVG